VLIITISGLYRNSPLHKMMTFSLDINDVKHIDLFMEIKINDEKYGRLYLPKLYLDINSRRIAEVEGDLLYDLSFNLYLKRLLKKQKFKVL